LTHGRYLDPWSPYHNLKLKHFYEYLFTNYPLVAEFRDRELIYAHPRIRIFGRQNREPPGREDTEMH